LDIIQQAQSIVEGATLEEKLKPLKYTEINKTQVSFFIDNPGRNKNINFSSKQLKFPAKNKLATIEGAGIALHFFANHELLAIEMMAMAILKYPLQGEAGDHFRKGMISTIRDEQKHFTLYNQRMESLGIEFGDLPVNDFFWKQIHDCPTIESFHAMMSLTFESANLDFAYYYKGIFKDCEDFETANILEIVLEDELRHVAAGWNYLNDFSTKSKKDIWDHYLSLLPGKITPARAKGINFNCELRKRAGLNSHFINKIKNYKSDFNITNRNSWDSK
jgi:uncharacterized ferritin-like protein (DUF455 family)